jgi:predicted pyridoxine 5'-phosphate oxidase superfamily flavin-nucleotide-binding protein
LSRRAAPRHLKVVLGPFHDGEREVQARAGVRQEAEAVGRIIRNTIPPVAGRFLARQRLAVATTLDSGGRVWASLLTGEPGFIRAVDETLLRLDAQPVPGDPLPDNLATQPWLGLLVLDPQTRGRMRFNGRGLASADGLFLEADQVYGNCPKYIQLRRLEPDAESAPAAAPGVSRHLDSAQQSWIANADTFFIGTFHPQAGADASHRGGFPGFVRVTASDQISFPDYPGNAMFNTLGNLRVNPRAGLLFVDFTTGDVLQLTGRARVGDDFVVTFDVDEVRETRGATRLRFVLVEYSPANPVASQRAVTPRSRRHLKGTSRPRPAKEKR